MIDEAVELLAASVCAICFTAAISSVNFYRRLPIPSEALPCFGILSRALVAVLIILQLELHEGLAGFIDQRVQPTGALLQPNLYGAK